MSSICFQYVLTPVKDVFIANNNIFTCHYIQSYINIHILKKIFSLTRIVSMVFWTRTKQMVHSIERGLKSYLTNRFFPLINFKEKDYEVRVPLTGRKTIVRFINLPDGRTYVLRVYMKNELDVVHRHRLAEYTLSRSDVNYPKIIDFVDDPAKYGAIVLVEEHIKGNTINKIDYSEELSNKIAIQLANLHNIKSDQFGTLDNLKDDGFFKYIIRRISHRFSSIKRSSIIREKRLISHILKWFTLWDEKFKVIHIYNLTHDKLNESNIILTDDGKIHLIDFATLQYAYLGKDLVKIHHSFCKNDNDKINIFNKTYFAYLSEKDEEKRFNSLKPFYHSWHHISFCASYCKRFEKSIHYKTIADAPNKELALKHWSEVKEITGIF